MSAEDIWSQWEAFLEPPPGSDEELEGPEAELRRAALEWGRELVREEEMAQAADIAQLLAQLTAADIAQQQRDVARDAQIVAGAAVQTREDSVSDWKV